VTSAEARADEQFVAASEDRRLRRRAAAFGQQRQRVWEVLAAYPDGCNATTIRDALGINGERMARILQVLVTEGEVIKTEEQVDRRRYKVTYRRRIHPMDLSQAAIEARRAGPRDQKVYNLGSGHFVDPPKLVRLNAADLRQAAGRVAQTSPLADKPPVPPTGGVFRSTESGPPRIPAPPSSPARTAPGAGALPLPGPDTFSNPGTAADPSVFHSTESSPPRIPAPPSSPARPAPGAGAMPLPGPDTFANQGTAADRSVFHSTESGPPRIPAPPSSPARTAPGAGASPLPQLWNAVRGQGAWP
jgi:hypothetical protein